MNTLGLKYLPTAGIWLVALVLLVLIERISVPRYQWDRYLLSLAHGLRGFRLDRFFALITWAGSLFILVPVTALICGFLCQKRTRRRGLVAGSKPGRYRLVQPPGQALVRTATSRFIPGHWRYPLGCLLSQRSHCANRRFCGGLVLDTETRETGAYLLLFDGDCPVIGVPGCPLPHLSSGSFPFGCSGRRLAGFALGSGFI